MRSTVTIPPARAGTASMTCSIVGGLFIGSTQQLALDRVGQPCLEGRDRPAPLMDEQVEESGIDEDPQDVGRALGVQALAKPTALLDEVTDDTAGPDPTLRSDRLEDVTDLGIRAGGTPHGFIDRSQSL